MATLEREPNVRRIVRMALQEDLPWGDITTESLIPAEALACGRLVAKDRGVLCGLDVAAAVFHEVDPALEFESCTADGSDVEAGEILAEVRGKARAIVSAERTALNLVQRMSGVATATNQYVRAVAGTGATIVDTRKTAPGMRFLDKYAVRCGGGSNHRYSLSDGVLVKDNHVALLQAAGSEPSLAHALRIARAVVPHMIRIEVEVDRLDQLPEVLEGGADIILLDNMSCEEMRQAVVVIGGRALTEASGGVTLDRVREIATTGVDLISVGALTHSVSALDISLEVTPGGATRGQ